MPRKSKPNPNKKTYTMYRADVEYMRVEKREVNTVSAQYVYFQDLHIKTRENAERKESKVAGWCSTERQAYKWLEKHFAGKLEAARKDEQTAMRQLGEIRRLCRKRFSDGQQLASKTAADNTVGSV